MQNGIYDSFIMFIPWWQHGFNALPSVREFTASCSWTCWKSINHFESSLTLSSLNLSLSSSSTTSRNAILDFIVDEDDTTWSGWQMKTIIVIIKTISRKCSLYNPQVWEIRSFFRDSKWCFDASWGLKGWINYLTSRNYVRNTKVSLQDQVEFWHLDRISLLAEIIYFLMTKNV